MYVGACTYKKEDDEEERLEVKEGSLEDSQRLR